MGEVGLGWDNIRVIGWGEGIAIFRIAYVENGLDAGKNAF
jgi:hypothetical protein